MSQAIMKIQAINDTQTIESREVAKMLGKVHKDLMDSINLYVSYLEKGEIPLPNFFIPSMYTKEEDRQSVDAYVVDDIIQDGDAIELMVK